MRKYGLNKFDDIEISCPSEWSLSFNSDTNFWAIAELEGGSLAISLGGGVETMLTALWNDAFNLFEVNERIKTLHNFGQNTPPQLSEPHAFVFDSPS